MISSHLLESRKSRKNSVYVNCAALCEKMKFFALFLAIGVCCCGVYSRPTIVDSGDVAQNDLRINKENRLPIQKLDLPEINKGLDFFEGDIILNPILHRSSAYNAIADKSHKWTNNIIPYKVEESYGFEKEMVIFKSLSEFNVRTCVTFRPAEETDQNYIYIKKGEGCYSSVGMNGNGEQILSIGNYCEYKGTIQHEAMHALGFWHEQSRTDRDNYVVIMWENINDADEHNFKKYSSDQIDTLGLPYDYSSLLHYGPTYFSINGNNTIEIAPSHRGEVTDQDMGQRTGFTNLDLTKIRTLYECDLNKYHGWSEWTGWSVCDNECKRRRWRFCNDEDATVCSGEEEQSESCDNCIENSVSDCGETIFGGWEGNISSPLFPYNYVDNAHCEYQIRKQFDQYPIFLSFVEFDIEEEKTYCAFDNLKIFDEDITNADLSICGNRLPVDKVLQGTEPKLQFTSDYVTTKPGFKAFYFNVPVMHHCPFEFEPLAYGWKQDTKTDDFDWTWIAGSTPSGGTGPSADHSLQNNRGHYIFIETSSPRATNELARIMSPTFEASPDKNCMQFHYHMYGNYIGALKVYAIHPDTKNVIGGIPGFSRSGNQGNEWKSAFLPTPTGTSYQIVFEAIRGGGYTSDIAIDDVRFFGISCEELEA